MRKEGFLNVGMPYLTRSFVAAALIVLLAALPPYDGWFLAYESSGWPVLFRRLGEQIALISEHRSNPNRSKIIMWLVLALSFIQLLYLLYVIPTAKIVAAYISRRPVKCYLAMLFALAFLLLMDFLALFESFEIVDWAFPAKGVYAERVRMMIHYDLGLGLSMLLLLSGTALSLAILAKTSWIYIASFAAKAIRCFSFR